jgi:hypothetical protein
MLETDVVASPSFDNNGAGATTQNDDFQLSDSSTASEEDIIVLKRIMLCDAPAGRTRSQTAKLGRLAQLNNGKSGPQDQQHIPQPTPNTIVLAEPATDAHPFSTACPSRTGELHLPSDGFYPAHVLANKSKPTYESPEDVDDADRMALKYDAAIERNGSHESAIVLRPGGLGLVNTDLRAATKLAESYQVSPNNRS